ncbi:MAG: hypothetical protein LBL99_02180 [Holosporaceae bacterium]|jgi:hypothetical protein|nr:hypothetical protein [Holosporaceae bacterium]
MKKIAFVLCSCLLFDVFCMQQVVRISGNFSIPSIEDILIHCRHETAKEVVSHALLPEEGADEVSGMWHSSTLLSALITYGHISAVGVLLARCPRLAIGSSELQALFNCMTDERDAFASSIHWADTECTTALTAAAHRCAAAPSVLAPCLAKLGKLDDKRSQMAAVDWSLVNNIMTSEEIIAASPNLERWVTLMTGE